MVHFLTLSSDLLSSPSPQPCHCHWLSWRAPHRAEQEASLQVELPDAATLPLGIRQPFPRQVHQHFADITNTRSSSFGLLPLLYTHWLGSGQAPANPSGPRSRGSAGTGCSKAPCLQPTVLGFPNQLTLPTDRCLLQTTHSSVGHSWQMSPVLFTASQYSPQGLSLLKRILS